MNIYLFDCIYTHGIEVTATQIMNDIPYLRIRVMYVLHPCVLGFALHNVRSIFIL